MSSNEPEKLAVNDVARNVKVSKDVGVIAHLTGAPGDVNLNNMLINRNNCPNVHTYVALSNHLNVMVRNRSGNCVDNSSHHKVVMDVD